MTRVGIVILLCIGQTKAGQECLNPGTTSCLTQESAVIIVCLADFVTEQSTRCKARTE